MTDALKGVTVKPLVWAKSETGAEWDGDYHTIPTGYTIRGVGNEEYRLSFAEGFVYDNSPEMMMERAQAHHERRILSAITTPPDVRADALREAAKTLLSGDENGSRKEVYNACAGNVKVYKLDDFLEALIEQLEGSESND